MTDGGALDVRRLSLESWDRLYGESNELVWGRDPVGFLAPYLERLGAELGPGSRILDAACGEGRNIPCLACLGCEIHACDASEKALDKAKSWLSEPVSWSLCDLRALPHADGFFDAVLAADVLQAVPDLEPVLAELARVLRPGGLLLCNIPDLSDGIVGDRMESLPDGGYLYQGRYFFRFMSFAEAGDAFRAAGFEVLDGRRVTWVESAHPGYRSDEHEHTSVVYVARRDRG